MAAFSSRFIPLLLLGLLVAALAQEAPVAPSPPDGLCPGFEAILGMANYTTACNACFAAGCGICSPPVNKANQLGAASCLIDETYCHSPRFFKADEQHAASICHVTIIPFAAVIGVLVALVLCCGGCTGYCCFTLQKQRKLKRMIKAKQLADQQQAAEAATTGSVEATPQPRTDGAPGTSPVSRNV